LNKDYVYEDKKTGATRTYSFGMIPALEAVDVEIMVAKVIGEPLFQAFTAAKKDGEEISTEETQSAGAAAIGLMLSRMEPENIKKAMATVFTYVNCDGKRIEINSHFTGKNKEMWQVFLAALRYNFSDFFPESLLASVSASMTK
jgi:hypothetical protein